MVTLCWIKMMQRTSQNKKCELCKKTFYRKERESDKVWILKKFCSKECALRVHTKKWGYLRFK